MKRIQMALSAILFTSLALYGWAQQGRPSDDRADDSRIAVVRHEKKIVAQLNLTARQKTDYDKLQTWLKSENAKLEAMPRGQVEAGKEINRRLHEGLKSIFTPVQYDKYVQLWRPTPLARQDPMAGGKPFASMDEAILSELGLTQAQWARYGEFRREADRKNSQLHDLMKTDPQAAGFMSGDINRWSRASMKKILTEDQYYEWVFRWDEIMAPYFANGAKHKGEVRQGRGGGTIRPIAGKTGG